METVPGKQVSVWFTFQVTLMLWDEMGSRWTSWGGPSGAERPKPPTHTVRGGFHMDWHLHSRARPEDRPLSTITRVGGHTNLAESLCIEYPGKVTLQGVLTFFFSMALTTWSVNSSVSKSMGNTRHFFYKLCLWSCWVKALLFSLEVSVSDMALGLTSYSELLRQRERERGRFLLPESLGLL